MTGEETQTLADELGVEPTEVVELEKRLYAHDATFDEPVDVEPQTSAAPSTYLEDWRFEPERSVAKAEWEAHTRERLQQIRATRWGGANQCPVLAPQRFLPGVVKLSAP